MMMRHIPSIDRWDDVFNGLEMEPLIVRANMVHASAISVYSQRPIRLDALLAWVIVKLSLGNGVLDNGTMPLWTPLPIRSLWHDDIGRQLWASSALTPVTDNRDVVIQTKRSEFRHSNTKYRRDAGRWMSRMSPTPISVTDMCQAYVYGHKEWIEHLLAHVDAIGKHRSRGLGAVQSWEVISSDFDPIHTAIQDNVIQRELPVRSAHMLGMDTTTLPPSTPIAWYPPYWAPYNMEPGWTVGTFIGDFF